MPHPGPHHAQGQVVGPEAGGGDETTLCSVCVQKGESSAIQKIAMLKVSKVKCARPPFTYTAAPDDQLRSVSPAIGQKLLALVGERFSSF